MSLPGVAAVRRVVTKARGRRIWRNLAGPKLLRAFAERYPSAFFIEVGSNDGDHFDHLREYTQSGAWSGIMIEPVPYVFERLRRNYGGRKGIALENAAIADRDGRMPFYHLSEAQPEGGEEMPSWYDGLGSFSRETILSHGDEIPGIEELIVTTEVPCLTFESLCRKHGVEQIDLLLVDTEGYDYELLRSIDLASRHPRMAIYEHFHLSPSDRAACREWLERHGYETMEEGFDTFCLDTSESDSLTAAWRSTKPALRGLSAGDEGL